MGTQPSFQELKILRHENSELKAAVKILQDQIIHYQVEKDYEYKTFEKNKDEINKLKKILNDKENEIKKLNTNFQDILFQQKLLMKQIPLNYNEVKNMEEESQIFLANVEELFKKQLSEKEVIIKKQEKMINDLKSNDNKKDKIIVESRLQPKNYEKDYEILQKSYRELDEKYKILKKQYKDLEKKINENSIQNISVVNNSKMLKKKVKMEDVKNIGIIINNLNNLGIEIKYKLIIEKIEYDEIEKLLYPKGIKNEFLNITQMLSILEGFPFFISNNEQKLTIARYLIEEDEIDSLWTEYNPENSEKTELIAKVLKKLIGYYNIFTEEEVLNLSNEFKNFLKTNKEELKKSINSNKTVFNCEDIKTAIKTVDPEISNKLIEFYLLELYKKYSKITNFSVDEFIYT